jgi:hypothetical protein
MAPRKVSIPKGLIPKVKSFWERLSDKVLHVIEEALASENFKEKTWAVDWFFKHLPAAEPKAATPAGKKGGSAQSEGGTEVESILALEAMSEEELLGRIRDHLKDWEPD